MNETHFAIRKIKNGRVRIGRKMFKPDEQFMPYDGRLDGLRMAFGRYPEHGKDGYQDFVCLWGTARRYFSKNPQIDWPGPECVNGIFVWAWWRAV